MGLKFLCSDMIDVQMSERQIRIFVPPQLDGKYWVETVVGRVIGPVVEAFSPTWIWFSRYCEGEDASNVDCDITQIPRWFGPNGFYRSVRFRVSIPTAIQEKFEEATMATIDESGFKASGFLHYPYINDLGGDRFIAEPRTHERRKHRADLMVEFLNASAKLFLHALLGPDEQGLYRLEHNADASLGSSFGVIRHLFCNMTNAPTPVFLDKNGKVKAHPSDEVQVLIEAN